MKNLLIIVCLPIAMISCESTNLKEGADSFKMENDKTHYILVTFVDSNKNNVYDAKSTISSYNKRYHESESLKITDIFIDPESLSRLILLRGFDNKFQAMAYIAGTLKNSSDFINSNEIAYEIFAATQGNYREVIKQKTIDNYKLFYQENYLK